MQVLGKEELKTTVCRSRCIGDFNPTLLLSLVSWALKGPAGKWLAQSIFRTSHIWEIEVMWGHKKYAVRRLKGRSSFFELCSSIPWVSQVSTTPIRSMMPCFFIIKVYTCCWGIGMLNCQSESQTPDIVQLRFRRKLSSRAERTAAV